MEESCQHELISDTNGGAEKNWVDWKSENITMNQLPSGLLFIHNVIIKFHVPREIILQHSEKNDG